MPSSKKDKKNKSSKKKKQEKMRTRKTDAESSRKTKRSSHALELYDELHNKKRKKKNLKDNNTIETKASLKKKNEIEEASSDSDSEYSRSKLKKSKKDKNLMKEIENQSDSESSKGETINSALGNEIESIGHNSDADSPESEQEEEEIAEDVQSNISLQESKPMDARKVINVKKTASLFSAQTIQNLRYYARNSLFQKIKIINENHLESKGKIMEEALKQASINPNTTPNLNAYMNEIRQILKRNICSRRGYVKRQIGEQLKGRVIGIYFLTISFFELSNFTLIIFQILLKTALLI